MKVRSFRSVLRNPTTGQSLLAISTIAFIVFLSSCSAPARPPQPSDIVGMWEYTEQASNYRPSGPAATLDFRSDGTFEMNNSPGVIWASDRKIERGTWRLLDDQFSVPTLDPAPWLELDAKETSDASDVAEFELEGSGKTLKIVANLGNLEDDLRYVFTKD